MTTIHDALGREAQSFGGVLRCESCGDMKALGSVGAKLRDGWPKCCGYTMRWWTQRQIDSGEMSRARVSR